MIAWIFRLLKSKALGPPQENWDLFTRKLDMEIIKTGQYHLCDISSISYSISDPPLCLYTPPLDGIAHSLCFLLFQFLEDVLHISLFPTKTIVSGLAVNLVTS